MMELYRFSLIAIPFTAALLGTELQAFADDDRMIVQKGRTFLPRTIEAVKGDTLKFNNEDEFIHQIYITSDELNFDSAEQPPGQFVTVRLTAAGTFPVRCHIHPKMLLRVTVK
jgi:plastocyanin